MLLRLLNTDLDSVSMVEIYESLIWTERYQEYGDFELYAPVTSDILSLFKQDYYLENRESDQVMIIEKIVIETDAEAGNHVTITGRSLESLLDRRIIWGTKTLNGNFQNGIRTLLEESIIKPLDGNRKISNFIFEESTDPLITSLTIDVQYTGDSLYKVISDLCKEHDIGFKVTLNDYKQFVFKLYAGTDRSYEQVDNPCVVFSPNFENLINSNYIESKSAMKNVTLVGGEDRDVDGVKTRHYVTVGSASGLGRREMFTDARDIQSDDGDGNTLSDAEYDAKLDARGNEDLTENKSITSFEGEIETTLMFKYGEDFFNGDIIQIANEYGHEAKARILEVVTTEDESGLSVRPTFSTITEEGEQ